MLDQGRLNIEDKSRASRLPWRGQFSPEFVEYIMKEVCNDSRSFLDPFCGSGTVLFEATARGCASWGAEVNPAAWHLASISEFAQLDIEEKNRHIKAIKSLAITYGSSENFGLPSLSNEPSIFLEKVKTVDATVANLLASLLLLGMCNNLEISNSAISRGAFILSGILNEMLTTDSVSKCHLADARYLPLEDDLVEAVITSPPYINVFNYHQNYRPATELLGWKPLQAARSEIGSNRKHRMNRFLTVIQYCMDMCVSLSEISRVMKAGRPIIIVLGRISKVQGCSFENGKLIREIMEESGAFGKFRFSERVFTNRFGEKIYEDIIIAEKIQKVVPKTEHAKFVGIEALKKAVVKVSSENKSLLDSAIEMGNQVKLSPKLELTIPSIFEKTVLEKNVEYGSYSKAIAR